MTGIVEQLLLAGILAVAAGGLVFAVRARRRTASRLEALSDTVSILVKTNYHNSKQLRESGDLLKNVHQTGLESLAFQRKAHDHQRVLMASLNRQAAQIGQMLGAPEQGRETNGQERRATSQPASRLPRRAGFRMAPVLGAGQTGRVGTVPLASLLSKQPQQAPAPQVHNKDKVVAVEELFGETAGGHQSNADSELDNAADALAEELRQMANTNHMTAQKVANG